MINPAVLHHGVDRKVSIACLLLIILYYMDGAEAFTSRNGLCLPTAEFEAIVSDSEWS